MRWPGEWRSGFPRPILVRVEAVVEPADERRSGPHHTCCLNSPRAAARPQCLQVFDRLSHAVVIISSFILHGVVMGSLHSNYQ